MGFLHMLVNIICLTPLMERFEAEYGTLNTTALFLGREYCDSWRKRGHQAERFTALATLPAALYILVDMVILGYNTPILGAR